MKVLLLEADKTITSNPLIKPSGDLEQPLMVDDVHTMQFPEEMYGK